MARQLSRIALATAILFSCGLVLSSSLEASGRGTPKIPSKIGRPNSAAKIPSQSSSGVKRTPAQSVLTSPSPTNGPLCITTVAGNGTRESSGDGGLATLAGFGWLNDIAVDDSGNVYVAELEGNYSNRIRMITPYGGIMTIAGNGSGAGYSGDGGLAIDTDIRDVHDITVHSHYLYLASKARIRRVDLNTDIITTIAGIGSEDAHEMVHYSVTYSEDGRPATEASIHPYAMAFDTAGNLYFMNTEIVYSADPSYPYYSEVNRILKIDTRGIITTVAGNGVADRDIGESEGVPATSVDPCGFGLDDEIRQQLAVDDSGNLYFNCDGIREVDNRGIITRIGHICGSADDCGASPDGPAAWAGFTVDGIAAEGHTLYFTTAYDRLGPGLRMINLRAGTLSTLAGRRGWGFSGDGGSPRLATLGTPGGVAVRGGRIWFLDQLDEDSATDDDDDHGPMHNLVRKIGPCSDVPPRAPIQ